MDHFPKVRGENKQYLKPPPSYRRAMIYHINKNQYLPHQPPFIGRPTEIIKCWPKCSGVAYRWSTINSSSYKKTFNKTSGECTLDLFSKTTPLRSQPNHNNKEIFHGRTIFKTGSKWQFQHPSLCILKVFLGHIYICLHMFTNLIYVNKFTSTSKEPIFLFQSFHVWKSGRRMYGCMFNPTKTPMHVWIHG